MKLLSRSPKKNELALPAGTKEQNLFMGGTKILRRDLLMEQESQNNIYIGEAPKLGELHHYSTPQFQHPCALAFRNSKGSYTRVTES